MSETPPPPREGAPAAPIRRRRPGRKQAELRAGAMVVTTLHLVAGRRLMSFVGLGLLAFLPALAFDYWSHREAVEELQRIGSGIPEALQQKTLLAQVPVRHSVGTRFLGTLIALTGLMFLCGAVTCIVVQDLHRARHSLARAISVSLRQLVPMAGIALMTGIPVLILGYLVGFLIDIIPLAFFSSVGAIVLVAILLPLSITSYLVTQFSVSVPVMILEKRSAFPAIARSDELTRGVRWVILTAGAALCALPMWAMRYAQHRSATVSDWESAVFVGFGAQVVGGILLAVFCTVVYRDARASAEGIDTSNLATVFD